MSGALLMVAARFDLGAVADVLSKPVLVGYANGAALILVASQLSALLGVPLPREGLFHKLSEAAMALPHAHVPTLALGLVLVAVLLACRVLVPRAPAPLIAVIAWHRGCPGLRARRRRA